MLRRCFTFLGEGHSQMLYSDHPNTVHLKSRDKRLRFVPCTGMQFLYSKVILLQNTSKVDKKIHLWSKLFFRKVMKVGGLFKSWTFRKRKLIIPFEYRNNQVFRSPLYELLYVIDWQLPGCVPINFNWLNVIYSINYFCFFDLIRVRWNKNRITSFLHSLAKHMR